MSTSIPGTFASAPPPPSYPCGLYELNQYAIFTRASAKAAGLPPECYPPFNPALPVKNTVILDVDDTVPNAFRTLAYSKQGDAMQIIVPAKMMWFMTQPGQAATLNLPDETVSYPPYVVAPTNAYINNGGTINPEYLSTMDQAKAMAAALGVPNAAITEYQPAPGPGNFLIVYPADEPRREYVFTDNFGQEQIVGIMERAMNQYGEGYPGEWINDGKTWQWIPLKPATPAIPHGPIFPMPMRGLMPGETIQFEFGMVPMLFGPSA
jgi:hypothetical protein